MAQGFEIDFLPVGENSCSGDAICVRYGSAESGYKIHVIDGGYKNTATTIMAHLTNYYGSPRRIDHVVLTHPHTDHAGGLAEVLENYEVGALWMHRPWLYASQIVHHFHGNWTAEGLAKHLRDELPTLVELESSAIRKDIPICEPFQGANIGKFLVLAPSKARYLQLLPDFDKAPERYTESASPSLGKLIKKVASFIKESWSGETLSETPEPTDAVNETSIVQVALFEEKFVARTSDTGPSGLDEAASYLAQLGTYQPSFFQVPHHGSRRNVTPSALNRWLGRPMPTAGQYRGTAFCSAASDDEEHPRKKVLNAFLRRGYPVHTTNGISLRHFFNMPDRGWPTHPPEPFSPEVEE